MLVSKNSDTNNYVQNRHKRLHTRKEISSLPSTARFILRLFNRITPKYIPVAIKLALSIGILLTLVMTLLGGVIIHKQTQLMRNQIKLQGSTLVQTLAKSLGDPMILALPSDKALSKNDPLDKRALLLTLKTMVTQITTSPGILGASVYSDDGKVLSSRGINPFVKDAPYEKQRKLYLTDRLKNLEWKWADSPQGYVSAITFISPIKLQDTTFGHAVVTFNHELLDNSIADVIQSIIIATLLMILLGIIISYILGRRLTRPLYDLMEASREIGHGNYSYRLPEQRRDEIGYLMKSYNTMAQGLYQKAQVEDAFSRHVSPSIAKEIIANMDRNLLSTKHVHASVLFVDIVGFTAISESMSPERVAHLLNEFYTGISKVSKLYQGTIDKYMGDCAMVVFGIPEQDEDHVFHSIACGVAFRKLMLRYNELREQKGLTPIHFRIGVNTGDMLAGNMGPAERIQYTVVGDSVNLASRLCAVAPADSVIITDNTYNLSGLRLKLKASKHECIEIRGITEPVNTYLVQDLHERYSGKLDQEIDRIVEELIGTNTEQLMAE